jgi:hypothetical protein
MKPARQIDALNLSGLEYHTILEQQQFANQLAACMLVYLFSNLYELPDDGQV